MTDRTLKYIAIKTLIKDRIANGKLIDKLPGERTLADELNVSYMTVRKAIAGLVEDGILSKEGTRGTFVNNKKNHSKPTHNIGYFLDDDIKEGISSPYYSLIFKSLEQEVARNGYNLLFLTDFDDLNPLKNARKVDGVIISCFPRIEDRIQQIKDFLPIVLLDNLAADKSIPSVTIDNFNSCSHAVDYLIDLGHNSIGFVSGLMDSDVCRDRLLGYKTALSRANIKETKTFNFKGDYSFESGEKAGMYFLSMPNPPSAIVCANDMMAIGLMKVLQENGIKIPEQISVIGFDDILLASKVYPTLTTNAAPIAEMARKAVEILIAGLKGLNIDYRHEILRAHLITRDSCRKHKN